MRIAELSPLLQPAAEPGAINAGDNAAGTGSSEFQSIISQMTGSEANQSGETTVRSGTERFSGSLPMSMLVAELTFDGAVDEADQKLQSDLPSPVIPMAIADSKPAETAVDSKPPDVSEDGNAAITAIAHPLTAGVVDLPAPTTFEKLPGAACMAPVPFELAVSASPVVPTQCARAIPPGDLSGMVCPGNGSVMLAQKQQLSAGAGSGISAIAAADAELSKSPAPPPAPEAGIADGIQGGNLQSSDAARTTGCQAAAQPANGITADGETALMETTTGTGAWEIKFRGEIPYLPGNHASATATEATPVSDATASAKLPANPASSSDIPSISGQVDPGVVEMKQSDVDQVQTAFRYSAERDVPSLEATEAGLKTSGHLMNVNLKKLPGTESPLAGPASEAASAAPGISSQEPSPVSPVPEAIPDLAGTDAASKVPPGPAQSRATEDFTSSQSHAEAMLPIPDTDLDSTVAQSRQSDAESAETDSVPASSNGLIAGIQGSKVTAEGSGSTVVSVTGTEAESAKSTEASPKSPGSPELIMATDASRPSAGTQTQQPEPSADPQSLHAPNRPLITHKTEGSPFGAESLNLESPVGSGGDTDAEIATTAQLQRAADLNGKDSTVKPSTGGLENLSTANAPKGSQRTSEPTANTAGKAHFVQTAHACGNPGLPAEPAENKLFTLQEVFGRTEQKAAGDAVKPFRANPSDGKDIARQPFPGMNTPLSDKTSVNPKAAQPMNARPGEFVFELAGKIQTLVKAGEGEIRIQLRPEHLGNLEIKVENGPSGIVARIAAESAHVKQFLENNLHSLQQCLQEQGLKVERIDIIVQEGLDLRQAGAHQQQSGQAGNGQQESTAAGGANARSSSRRPGDELQVDSVTAAVLGPNSTFHTVA